MCVCVLLVVCLYVALRRSPLAQLGEASDPETRKQRLLKMNEWMNRKKRESLPSLQGAMACKSQTSLEVDYDPSVVATKAAERKNNT